jgi:ATPase subunit of ABC transporter with duplicated ATPase domains
MEKASKTFRLEDGREKNVFRGASGVVRRLDKVALVGVNGAGKSTLLKLLTGSSEPTDGVCQVGASVKLGYFSQHALEVLNPQKTIFEEIHDRIPEATVGYVRCLLGPFLFSGEDVDKKIGVLSGGEKSLTALSFLFALQRFRPSPFYALDEVDSFLDGVNVERLAALIASQAEAAQFMVVSHRRPMIAAATRTIWVTQARGAHTQVVGLPPAA